MEQVLDVGSGVDVSLERQVYLAQDIKLNRVCAVKMLRIFNSY